LIADPLDISVFKFLVDPATAQCVALLFGFGTTFFVFSPTVAPSRLLTVFLDSWVGLPSFARPNMTTNTMTNTQQLL